MGGNGGQLVAGLWWSRTEENGAKQQGIRGRVPAERMGLGEESGQRWFWGVEQVKELGVSKGTWGYWS